MDTKPELTASEAKRLTEENKNRLIQEQTQFGIEYGRQLREKAIKGGLNSIEIAIPENPVFSETRFFAESQRAIIEHFRNAGYKVSLTGNTEYSFRYYCNINVPATYSINLRWE
jgi:hypothetical protein